LELTWTTLLLEILNFLILIWLLKRFFYQPVLRAIQRRQARLEATREEAERLRREAGEMRDRYQARLEEWAAEQHQARETLRAELRTERERLTQALMRNLEDEKRKAGVLAAREQRERERHLQREALREAGRFLSRLLQRVAGPEVEQRLIGILLDELPALPAERIAALKTAIGETDQPLQVSSAWPVEEKLRRAVRDVLETILGRTLRIEFTQDPDLLAGLRITAGPWILQANLADELRAFTELAHGA